LKVLEKMDFRSWVGKEQLGLSTRQKASDEVNIIAILIS
jgi:hypothetical protein